jgi:hypothetical protein
MIGIRTLHWNPGDPYPVSPVMGTPWDEPHLTADCTRHQVQGYPPAHSPIDEVCSCGTYAMNAWFTLIDAGGCFTSPYDFACVLDPFGKVVVHEKGWRAEKARVLGVGRAACLCGESDILALRAVEHFSVPFLETLGIIDMMVANSYARDDKWSTRD